MRPHKRILLYCEDADGLGRMTFLLVTRGYRVAGCWEWQDAERLAKDGCDVALLVEGSSSLDAVAELLKEVNPELPVVQQTKHNRLHLTLADGVVCESLGMGVLLDVLRVKLARKRGPKKGFQPKNGFQFPGKAGRESKEAAA